MPLRSGVAVGSVAAPRDDTEPFRRVVSPEVTLHKPARMAIAVGACVVGALPTFLAAPEDRALAMGLPAIALALGVILQRVDDRDRAFTVDLICAALLACPGLTAHGWLRLRATDAAAWYFPEQRVLGILEQAGAGGATAGILLGGAVALAALRGRRAVPLVAGMVAAGVWIGAGSLVVATLIDHLMYAPPLPLLLAAAVTAEWGAGAIFGAALAVLASMRSTPGRERVAAAVVGAGITAACTVPVATLVETLDLPTLPDNLPTALPGPRTVAPLYAPDGAPSADALAALLLASGHPTLTDDWTRRDYPRAPWHRGLRMGVVVALPPDTPRAELDGLARAAFGQNTFRMALPGRAEGLPPGLVDHLLGFPTVDLLLDPAPADAHWGTVHADTTVTWDSQSPEGSPPPPCALRADPDVTVGTLTTVAFRLSDRSSTERCRGIGWPPARCHPGGAGDPLCPSPP